MRDRPKYVSFSSTVHIYPYILRELSSALPHSHDSSRQESAGSPGNKGGILRSTTLDYTTDHE